jgi:hypothetical protein
MQIQQFIHLPSSPDKMLIFLELCQYPGTIIGTQLSSTRRHAPTSCLILRPHQEFKENCIPSYAGSACSRLRLLRCRHHHPPKSTLPTAACYCPLHLNPHDVQQLARNQQHHLPPAPRQPCREHLVPSLRTDLGEVDDPAAATRHLILPTVGGTVGHTPRVLMQGRRKSRRQNPTRIPLYSY